MARCPRRSAPRPAGTSCSGSAPARPASTTRTGAPRCASRSASASSRTSGTATCAKCAARPTSTSASATPPAADMARPRLALVPGEPAGVGPELCVRAAQRAWDADLVAYGDHRTLADAAARLGLPLQLLDAGAAHAAPGQLRLVDIPNAAAVQPGKIGRAHV